MSLLSLKGIGKIYASESSVAVGLRGIDLDFDIGEFDTKGYYQVKNATELSKFKEKPMDGKSAYTDFN